MKILITKKLNKTTKIDVEVVAADLKECLLQASVLLKEDECGRCKSLEIDYDCQKHKTDKGEFVYAKRICRKCEFESNMGTRQGGAGYFWKEWVEPYKVKNKKAEGEVNFASPEERNKPAENTKSPAAQQMIDNGAPPLSDEDIPF